MSDLTIIFIALAGFGGGYVVGHVHALMNYHKRRTARKVQGLQAHRKTAGAAGATDCRYDPKQFRRK